MWTFRKSVLAAIVVLAFFFFLRSTSPISSSEPFGSQSNLDDELDSSSKSYQSPSPGRSNAQQQQPLADNYVPRTLRERLQYQYPYDLESKFPAYIWQTWKVDPSSGRFDEDLRPFEASWTEKHPGFVHEVLTDENAVLLINYLYASVPEVLEAYKSMPIPVLKADFFRYLILLARGGIYSDIDTQALKSATMWLPDDYDRSQVGLIVGIEADPDRPDWNTWYSRRIQFCQWTIQSKPGHPVLLDVVATITEEALKMKKAGVLENGKMTKTIVEFTGPAVWTDTLFSYFNNEVYFDSSTKPTNITWEDFTGITETKKVGDVIVLPITSFSPGVGQMGAGEYDHPMAYVRHAFGGRNPLNLQNTSR
jgi:alpha 1,6-mannosyltransferase